MKKINNQLISQLFKFAIVGGIAAVVDVGILIILKELLHINVLFSSMISFCVSVTVNYILSMTFVFKGKEKSRVNEFLIFVVLSIGGLCINQLVLWVGINLMSIYYLTVKIIAMVIVPVYNFITRKIFLESKEK